MSDEYQSREFQREAPVIRNELENSLSTIASLLSAADVDTRFSESTDAVLKRANEFIERYGDWVDSIQDEFEQQKQLDIYAALVSTPEHGLFDLSMQLGGDLAEYVYICSRLTLRRVDQYLQVPKQSAVTQESQKVNQKKAVHVGVKSKLPVGRTLPPVRSVTPAGPNRPADRRMHPNSSGESFGRVRFNRSANVSVDSVSLPSLTVNAKVCMGKGEGDSKETVPASKSIATGRDSVDGPVKVCHLESVELPRISTRWFLHGATIPSYDIGTESVIQNNQTSDRKFRDDSRFGAETERCVSVGAKRKSKAKTEALATASSETDRSESGVSRKPSGQRSVKTSISATKPRIRTCSMRSYSKFDSRKQAYRRKRWNRLRTHWKPRSGTMKGWRPSVRFADTAFDQSAERSHAWLSGCGGKSGLRISRRSKNRARADRATAVQRMSTRGEMRLMFGFPGG